MAIAPPLNPPRLGDPITQPNSILEAAYVKRSRTEKQAGFWNEVLAEDPAFGPAGGLVVGVAPVKDGNNLYPLVWVEPPGEH
ncbi:hypothetical protein [Mycobacteroides abscessus]|uniref:hypothetical protein n=1 Tax=Mycobacteroides abscessus TaxID=36809 RepID=UPI000C268580|nr:hypothetical protein [Mycobacteroides abscessus]